VIVSTTTAICHRSNCDLLPGQLQFATEDTEDTEKAKMWLPFSVLSVSSVAYQLLK
jgi:hypothetical protein